MVGTSSKNFSRSTISMRQATLIRDLKKGADGMFLKPPGCPAQDEMTSVKLWQNPCWFTYRLNYLALRYNSPLYGWVEEHYGLLRPEFVVLFSLGLSEPAYARDIAASSGFPENTLSRAIHKLTGLRLLSRKPDEKDGRRFILKLTKAGREIFDETLPQFVSFEQMMLDALTADEQQTLSDLMAKMVLASPSWPDAVSERPKYRKD